MTMAEIDDGGPAFPRSDSLHAYAQDGMSLRDHFAGLAMQIILKSEYKPVSWDPRSIAYEAFVMADAMIDQQTAYLEG